MQRNGQWLSVPQFGDWEQKGQLPDYSMDFSKIREMRKQNKRDASRASLGNEDDFINPTATINKVSKDDSYPHYHEIKHTPSVSIFSLALYSLHLSFKTIKLGFDLALGIWQTKIRIDIWYIEVENNVRTFRLISKLYKTTMSECYNFESTSFSCDLHEKI